MSCHWLDPRYMEELAALTPSEVTGRTGAVYRSESKDYLVPVLGRTVAVAPLKRDVRYLHRSEPVSLELALAALFYLLKCPNIEPCGKWVSEKELEGGLYMFRGTHELPLDSLAEAFGNDRQGFLSAGKRLGGIEKELADACLELPALPKVPVRLVLWLGDEEFPASVKMLFDETADKILPLDVIYGLGCDLCRLMLDHTQTNGGEGD